MNSNSITDSLADFATGLASVPTEVSNRLKLCTLDTLGVGVFSSSRPWCKPVQGVIEHSQSKHESSIWGTSLKASCDYAALANGTACHGFEFDEVHVAAHIHPGAAVLPAALALAEHKKDVDGKSLLLALAAGYECGIRIGLAAGNAIFDRGFHTQGILGTVAAAIASAKVLDISEEKMRETIGIACSGASGLMGAQYGGSVKRLNSGKAAQTGVLSALLANAGLTGIRNVLELDYGGFFTTFSEQRNYNPLRITDSLGTRFELLGVGPKLYPCVASNHTTIDVVRNMMEKDSAVNPSNVTRIIVKGSKQTRVHVGWEYVPRDAVAAQMNLPYALAALLTDGQLFIEEYTDKKIFDPAIVNLSKKVEVVEDPSITANGPARRHAVRVEIQLKDGRVLRGSEDNRKGSPENPMTYDEYVTKFKKLTGYVLSPESSTKVIELCDRLEKIDDVGELTSLLLV